MTTTTTTIAADLAIFDRAIAAIQRRGWGKMPGSLAYDQGGRLCLGYAIAAAMGKRYGEPGWQESPEMAVLAQAALARYPVAYDPEDYPQSVYVIVFTVNDQYVQDQDEAIAVLAEARVLAEAS